MNSREFFFLVASMRTAQTEYFQTRDQKKLRAARKLENEIDAEIRRVKDILSRTERASERDRASVTERA